jgi:hypothetical protein
VPLPSEPEPPAPSGLLAEDNHGNSNLWKIIMAAALGVLTHPAYIDPLREPLSVVLGGVAPFV